MESKPPQHESKPPQHDDLCREYARRHLPFRRIETSDDYRVFNDAFLKCMKNFRKKCLFSV